MANLKEARRKERERQAVYNRKNRAKVNAEARARRAKDPEKYREQSRAYLAKLTPAERTRMGAKYKRRSLAKKLRAEFSLLTVAVGSRKSATSDKPPPP